MHPTDKTYSTGAFRQPITLFKLLLTALLGIILMNPATAAPKFDITRPMPKINFLTVAAPTCDDETQYWPSLPTNPKADLYYRAARKIIGQRDLDNYKNSYILLRESTKLGHWKAKLLLAERYLQGTDSYYSEPRPKQSRIYIDELMTEGVPEAFYFMSQRRNKGTAGYTTSPSPASAYLYQAAELGHPQALVDVSNIFMNVKRQDVARKLLECGQKQGAGGGAANSLAISEFVNARTTEDFARGFKYLYIGAKAGDAESIFGLNYYNGQHQKKIGPSYLPDSKEYIRRVKIFTNSVDPRMYHDDPTKKQANGKFRRVKGNVFLKFPNLEKVIPLPPAKLPAWNGDIGVAMSPQDAKDYHEDFDYNSLVEEIKRGDIVSSSSEICPRSGYWFAVVPDKKQLVALYFDYTTPQWVVQGERFPLPHDIDEQVKSQINWQWDTTKNDEHQRRLSENIPILCRGGDTCPLAGIYRPQINSDHPKANIVNSHPGVMVYAGHTIPNFGLSQAEESLIIWQWVQPPRA